MRTIRIAIPTDDGIHMPAKMFGMVKYYYIYECTENSLKLVEKRKNTLAKEMPRGKTYYVIKELEDCNVFVVGNIGIRGRNRVLEKGKMIYDISSESLIEDVVASIQQDICGAKG